MLNAVMSPYNHSADDLTTINIGTMDIIVGFEREIDLTWIFWGWDGVRSEVEGVNLSYLPLAELDPRLDYYTPVFIAGEKILSERPETAKAFLRAVSRGYEATVADPQAAADTLLTYAPEIDPELATLSLEYLSDYFIADATQWGTMKEEVWSGFSSFLDEQGLLPNPFVPQDAYTNDFLPR